MINNKKIIKKLVLVCIFSWPSFSSAYIFNASLWRAYIAPQKCDKYIMVCHDLHNYSEALNKKQIDAFNSIIPSAHNVALIIENQPQSAQYYRDNKLYNVPSELQDTCLKAGFPVHEVDYRHKRARSYYTCIDVMSNNTQERYEQINKKLFELGFTTQELVREFESTVHETIKSINALGSNGTLYSWHVKSLLHFVDALRNRWESELKLWGQFNGTLLSYCSERNCLNEEYLGKALAFDLNLLDIRLLIKALEVPESMVIIYAGSAHCKLIEQLFGTHVPSVMHIDTAGVLCDVAQEGLQVPKNISSPQEVLQHWFYFADKILTTSGIELVPVDSSFLRSISDPASFVAKFSWLKKIFIFLKSLW